MNKTSKTILLTVAITLVLVYLVIALILPRQHDKNDVCSSVQIEIKDFAERQYIDDKEVSAYLETNGIKLKGEKLNNIQADSIERLLCQHPMIRHAECYKTTMNSVRIVLAQRVPIFRVENGTEKYFVDSDRQKMPIRSNTHADVLTAKGHIGTRMARNELYDLVEWIENNKYWCKKITAIQVNTQKDVVLKQREGADILLGSIDGFEKKMKKLQIWYQKGAVPMNWEEYKQLDVRYEKQVIGIKSSASQRRQEEIQQASKNDSTTTNT